MGVCKLCLSKKADKKNSHIIPKFLGKRLFDHFPNRHTLMVSRGTEKIVKWQDIPKEDFILCGLCEKRFELLETYFSKRLNDLFAFEKFPQRFQLLKIYNQEFIKTNFKPELFILFIYSMIWRASISSLQTFKDFKLPVDTEGNIRHLLNTNAASTHREMLTNSFQPNPLLNPALCLIKPKEYNDETIGILVAYQTSANAYMLFISEFIIFFYPQWHLAEEAHKNFTLTENAPVLIPVATTSQWNSIKQILLDKFSINRT